MLACFKKNLNSSPDSRDISLGVLLAINIIITYTLFLNALSKFVLCRFVLFNVSNVFEPASSKTPCVMEEGCAVALRSLVTR